MTDIKRKETLLSFVERYESDGISEHSYYRVCGQISFAKMCEIITDKEADNLMERVSKVKFGKEG